MLQSILEGLDSLGIDVVALEQLFGESAIFNLLVGFFAPLIEAIKSLLGL